MSRGWYRALFHTSYTSYPCYTRSRGDTERWSGSSLLFSDGRLVIRGIVWPGRLRDGLEFKTMFTTSSNTHAHDERTSIELFELWPSLPGPNRLWLKGRGQKDAGCCIMAEPLWIGSAGYWRNCCDTRGLGPDYTGSLWRFYPKR